LGKEGGNVFGDQFLSNLFIKKIKSDAAVEVLKMVKADTTLFVRKTEAAKMIVLGKVLDDTAISREDSSHIAVVRDSLLNVLKDSLLALNFNRVSAGLKPNSNLLFEEILTKIINADSLPSWSDTLRIRNTLFVPELDKKEQELGQTGIIQSLLKRLEAKPRYYIAGTDTVGLTICCPIDSVYMDPNKNFFQKLFGVGPAPNHGQIENGDYSWEEKK
jgi:hypothetical protein